MIRLSPCTTICALILSNRRQAIFTSSFCIHISYSVVSVVMYIADKSFQICLHFTLFNADAISIHVFYLSFNTNTCASTVIIPPSFTDLCVMHLLCQRLFKIRPKLVNSEKKSPGGSFEKYAGFRYTEEVMVSYTLYDPVPRCEVQSAERHWLPPGQKLMERGEKSAS